MHICKRAAGGIFTKWVMSTHIEEHNMTTILEGALRASHKQPSQKGEAPFCLLAP
jgi:hypothetical protein